MKGEHPLAHTIPKHPGIASIGRVGGYDGAFRVVPVDPRVDEFTATRVPGREWTPEEAGNTARQFAYQLRKSYEFAGVPYPKDWP